VKKTQFVKINFMKKTFYYLWVSKT